MMSATSAGCSAGTLLGGRRARSGLDQQKKLHASIVDDDEAVGGDGGAMGRDA
jgi:hypothetical protein